MWEDKYQGFDLEALEVAEAELEELYSTQAKTELDRLYDEGQYTTYHLEYDVDKDGTRHLVGLSFKKTGDMPVFRLVPRWDENGEPTIRDFLWLPPEQYPTVYETIDEWAWLMMTTQKMESDAVLSALGR